MIFRETGLEGAILIDVEKHEDERGFFARAFCREEFEANGLNAQMVQGNIGFSKTRGTLRGLHYQIAPHEETKFVRCTRGAVYDVIVDLRAGSSTFKKWFGIELSAGNRTMLYVPEGFAHGYQALADNSEVFYLVSQFYAPGAERGLRWNDPAFGIEWPAEVAMISTKDKNYPDFRE